jgi:hypothetical protein
VDDERHERDGEGAEDAVASDDPRDAAAEEPDPESSAASSPPPGQEPGEGKEHDL